ncbi:MAG: glycosyltransferase [Endozoicomonas sp.]
MQEEIPTPDKSLPAAAAPGIRLAIVIGTLEEGGAERMALNLLRELLSSGYVARLFCLGSDIDMPMPGSPQEQQNIRDAIISLSKGTAKQNTLRKAMAFPQLHWCLEREIRRGKVDLVISFMERANILSLMGTTRIPRIISIRNHFATLLADKSPLKRHLVMLGYRCLLRRASNINFNASEAADNFSSIFPGLKAPLSVINNFFDPDVLTLSQASPGKEAERLLSGNSIVITGRLMPVKGHSSLIRAFARVAENLPDSRLLILGDGPLRGELEQLINELGLQKQVFLAGFQSNPYAWLARARLFVLSSFSEGFPNALLEAVALGRPVISTDCHSGPRELLSPDSHPGKKTESIDKTSYGVLIPQLEQPRLSANAPLTAAEQAMAKAIQEMLSNPSLLDHYAKQSQQRAQDFTRSAVIEKWIDLIDSHCHREQVESDKMADHSHAPAWLRK